MILYNIIDKFGSFGDILIGEVYYDKIDKCDNIIIKDGDVQSFMKKFSEGEIFRYVPEWKIADIGNISTLREAKEKYPEYFL